MRLLFVEDDGQLRASLTRGLREASWDVDEAANGVQAPEMAGAANYDVIILDVLLPGASNSLVRS